LKVQHGHRNRTDENTLFQSAIAPRNGKICSKLFLSVKVAFFNELYDACQHHSCDYDAVRLAASTDARIGSGHTMVPGPDGHRGFGGHCFPKDVAAWCTFNSQEHSIVDTARKRNLELDRLKKIGNK